MSNRYSIAEARDHLAQVVHEAEKGVPIELTRRGKPVAVLVSTREYRRLTGRPTFWEAYQAFRQKYAPELAELEDDVEDPFAGVRDRSTGRDFSW